MTSRALVALGVLLGAQVAAGGTVQRFVLAAGANHGGAEREQLRYAITDAENFVRVLEEMGGVQESGRILLREPGVDEFRRGLERLQGAIALAAMEEGRREVLLYYSGHADGKGLLLADGRLTYSELRAELDAVPADVRIAVLDACASGAITRFKGGQRQPAFLVDDSSDMKGYAFLTSSSEDEAAQESDLIGASFFTYYLVSGLRGAADVSGDGRVTLGEAYQFAFHETLSRTTQTLGGAQHPRRDIDMSGTGDVVMTDLRQMSASLLLGEELEGRFFIRNADQQLVAELYKPAGRSVELGLEPGTYEVHMERVEELFLAGAKLGEGERLVLDRSQFTGEEREVTALRGAYPAPAPGGLTGRSRVELRLGWWSQALRGEGSVVDGSLSTPGVQAKVGAQDFTASLSYSRWLQEDLAVVVAIGGVGGDVQTRIGAGTGVATETVAIGSILMGVRRYLPLMAPGSAVRPFLGASVGSFIGTVTREDVGNVGVDVEVQTMGAFGGRLEAGVDRQLSRRLMLGSSVGYNLMTDFSEPLGKEKNYSGLEMNIGVSFLFGKGTGRSR